MGEFHGVHEPVAGVDAVSPIVLRPLLPADFRETTPLAGRDRFNTFRDLSVDPASGHVSLTIDTSGARDGMQEMCLLRLHPPPEWKEDGTGELVIVVDDVTHPGIDGPIIGIGLADLDALTTDSGMRGIGAGIRCMASPSVRGAAWNETTHGFTNTNINVGTEDPMIRCKIPPAGSIGGPSSVGFRQANMGVGFVQAFARTPLTALWSATKSSFFNGVNGPVVPCFCGGASLATPEVTITARFRWGISIDLPDASYYSAGG